MPGDSPRKRPPQKRIKPSDRPGKVLCRNLYPNGSDSFTNPLQSLSDDPVIPEASSSTSASNEKIIILKKDTAALLLEIEKFLPPNEPPESPLSLEDEHLLICFFINYFNSLMEQDRQLGDELDIFSQVIAVLPPGLVNQLYLKALNPLIDTDLTATPSRYPLHWAVVCRQSGEALAELLTGDDTLDPDMQSPWGETALLLAVTVKHLDAISALLNHLANPNIPLLENGETPLHAAISNDDAAAVKLLIRFANVNQSKYDSTTPLHEAIFGNRLRSLDVLLTAPNLELNSRWHASSNHYDTALALAAQFGFHECTKMLLAAGADPELACKVGTPLEIAIAYSYPEVIDVFFEEGIYINPASDIRPLLEVSKRAENNSQIYDRRYQHQGLFGQSLNYCEEHFGPRHTRREILKGTSIVETAKMPIGFTPKGIIYLTKALEGDKTALCHLNSYSSSALTRWFKAVLEAGNLSLMRLSSLLVSFRLEQSGLSLYLSEQTEQDLAQRDEAALDRLRATYTADELARWLTTMIETPENFYFHDWYSRIQQALEIDPGPVDHCGHSNKPGL